MDIRQFILPGGIGLTHVKVYDSAGAEGVPSGGAHLHLVCAEIYFPLAGTGQLELLSMDGLDVVDLIPNKAVFFRPGTIHRVLNPNKNLEILVIMQNGGLPERGDFVMTSPHEIVTNPTTYAQALRAPTMTDALRRRDLSLKGFSELKAAFSQSKQAGQESLQKFYRAARNLVAAKVDGFEWVMKVGAQAELKQSLDACDFIKAGRTDYLEHARHAAIDPLKEPGRPGMCGEVHSYAIDETFLPEGRKVA